MISYSHSNEIDVLLPEGGSVISDHQEIYSNSSSQSASLTLFINDVYLILKKDQILCSGAEYELYSKDPAANAKTPRCFVFPESRDEVVSIVKLAQKYQVKLWPYSTGKNWGYLNTSTSKNSVVVNLNRMNKILIVDEDLAYAVIEPGVTYEMLNQYLKKNNYQLWTDAPGGPPSGSVIGNALDRGVGVTKYGDHFAHLCGYEVVRADGTVLNTGVASTKNGKGASHMYKWGVGPYVEGLFSQSNYGIVTQAGIWLMRKPEDYSIFSLRLPDYQSLAKGMNTIREMMLKGVIHENGRFSNGVAILTLLTQAILEGKDYKSYISKEEFKKLKEKYYVPDWTASFAVYGEPETVHASSRLAKKILVKSKSCQKVSVYTKKIASRLRRLALWLDTPAGEKFTPLIDSISRRFFGSSVQLLKLFPGLIDLHEGTPVETVVKRGYFRSPSLRPTKDIHVGRDEIGIMWSVPVLPFQGEEVVAFAQLCENLFREYHFDFYMTIMIFGARSVCPLMVILYDRNDPKECERATKLYREILDLSIQHGYQHFRAGINGWDMLYQECPELKKLNQDIKKALDPNGIIAPGRYGID